MLGEVEVWGSAFLGLADKSHGDGEVKWREIVLAIGCDLPDVCASVGVKPRCSKELSIVNGDDAEVVGVGSLEEWGEGFPFPGGNFDG